MYKRQVVREGIRPGCTTLRHVERAGPDGCQENANIVVIQRLPRYFLQWNDLVTAVRPGKDDNQQLAGLVMAIQREVGQTVAIKIALGLRENFRGGSYSRQ